MYSAEGAMGIMRSKWDISPSAAGDMSTGDGCKSYEVEGEGGMESDGVEWTGLEGSEHSKMGVIGMNAIQVYVCPELRLGMINAYMAS